MPTDKTAISNCINTIRSLKLHHSSLGASPTFNQGAKCNRLRCALVWIGPAAEDIKSNQSEAMICHTNQWFSPGEWSADQTVIEHELYSSDTFTDTPSPVGTDTERVVALTQHLLSQLEKKPGSSDLVHMVFIDGQNSYDSVIPPLIHSRKPDAFRRCNRLLLALFTELENSRVVFHDVSSKYPPSLHVSSNSALNRNQSNNTQLEVTDWSALFYFRRHVSLLECFVWVWRQSIVEAVHKGTCEGNGWIGYLISQPESKMHHEELILLPEIVTDHTYKPLPPSSRLQILSRTNLDEMNVEGWHWKADRAESQWKVAVCDMPYIYW